MILEIDFIDETNEVTEEQIRTLQGLLDVAAISEGVQNGTELSVTFVDNERIQEINRDYRDKDRPTDVISFALEEIGEGEIEILGGDMSRVLGDIIISIPKTKEQAKEYGHSFTRELGFLTVHGFLHLIGYDHEEEAGEVIMFSKQRDILEAYGLKR